MSDVRVLSGGKVKRGDTAPSLRVQLLDDDGEAANFETSGPAPTASFYMREANATTLTVDAGAQIVNASNGIVEYEWSIGDTDTAATYEAEFEILGSERRTFPNDSYFTIQIIPDLGN